MWGRSTLEAGPLSIALPSLAFTEVQRALSSGADTDEAPALAALPDFDTVYREQRGRVLGAVRAIIGPSDEVDDVVQLAFIEIHRCLDRFEGRSRLSTWCYRIAINVALQHLRKKRRKRWLMLGVTGDESAEVAMPVHSARRLEDREILEKVYRAVDTLSEKKRVVWVLHEMQGQDPNEIAELLSIPMNTVRSRLLAARRDLMDELARMGVTPDGGLR
jgi:RNA polymerase sigma-70 factor (ECF subfamily)